jgi:hypothetical protein
MNVQVSDTTMPNSSNTVDIKEKTSSITDEVFLLGEELFRMLNGPGKSLKF